MAIQPRMNHISKWVLNLTLYSNFSLEVTGDLTTKVEDSRIGSATHRISPYSPKGTFEILNLSAFRKATCAGIPGIVEVHGIVGTLPLLCSLWMDYFDNNRRRERV